MGAIEDRIAAAEIKLKQLKAMKQKQAARERAKVSKQERAADTRRKILVGAFMLEQLERSGIGAALLTCEGKRFNEWLTREQDRELFKLIPTSSEQK
jgi:large subunit ribosomal protein L7/L12